MCPYYKNKEVFDSFNEMVEAFGGKPLTEEEFRSSELRKQRTGQDLLAMEHAYRCYHLNNGNFFDKAPNGKDSILFKSLLGLLRGNRKKAILEKGKVFSDNFFNWFGDWINDPDNASKVVDENGEPLVVYHGTTSDFTIFSKEKRGMSTGARSAKLAFFAASNEELAKDIYAQMESPEHFYQRMLEVDPNFTREDLGIGPEEPSIADRIYSEWAEYYRDLELEYQDVLQELEKYKTTHKETVNKTISKAEEWVTDLGLEDYIKQGYAISDAQRKEYENGKAITISKEIDVLDNPDKIEAAKVLDTKRSREFARKYEALDKELEEALEKAEKEDKNSYRNRVKALFINIKNPKVDSDYGGRYRAETYAKRIQDAINNGNDGGIIKDTRDPYITNVYYFFEPNQVKSAVNNASEDVVQNPFGGFSTENDDIYHNRTIWSMRDYLNDLLKHPKDRWKVKDLIARANRFYGRQMFHLYRDSDTHEFKVAIDQHIDGQLQDEIQRTYSRNETAIKEICEFLKSKFPDAKLTYDFYDEKQWHDFGFPLASNSFIRGNRVYLRKGRVTTEIAAEEFLHTLVYNLKYDNPTLYNNLLRYARKNFEKLNEEINLAYAEHQNRDEELVTQVLARYFNNKFDQSINVEKSKRNTLDSLLNRFKNWLIKLFKTAPVFSQYLQKYEITADNINPLVGFEDIADLLLTEDTAFVVNPIPSQQTRFSVSAQDRLDAANKSVIEQYKLLYKHFDSIAKLSNKPEDSIRHENLFRTISELRQRASDEALLYFVKQALDDIGEVGTTNPKTILYKLEKSYNLPDPFSDMTPQDIMNQKRYVIGFYQNVLKQIPRYDSDIFKNNPIFNTFVDDLKRLTESVDRAYYLWTQAVRISGDRIIDKIVDEDVTMADEQKENMKVVAKDWLHRNLFYGDISERLSQLVQSSGNNNLVVRMAMNLIGYAEQRRAEDSQHANNLLDRQRRRCLKNIKRAATPGNWETVFMEVDDDGVPTGNFSRPANYGLYEKDKNQFLKDLCERWERDYGFYYTEIDGDYVNSATGDRGVDENWIKDHATGKWIEPMYVKWQREIEMFDGDRIHRRYTHEYYMEQLTRPFTGSIEDLNNIAAPAAHGLSPKTRHKYNYYIENINYYLQKCIDRSTGIPHPERLSATDRVKLKMWQDAKKDLENPYTASGAPKVDEEFTMALEIAAWNKWVASKTNSSLDYDLYEKELQSVQNEANRTGNQQLVSDFINFNTELKIHPDYLPKLKFFKRWGNSNWMKYTAVLDQISRLIKIPNYPWSVDLSIVKNNIFFLIDAKNADAALNANINKPDYVGGKPSKDTLKALAEEYEDKISEHLAPYIDPSGRMWTKSGQPYNPSIHSQNDLLTWFDYLLEHFTNVAINSGTIPGIVDRLGNPVPCRSMTKQQIRDILEFQIFRVNKTFWQNGARVIRYVPLSIFNVKLPRYSDFIAGDGKRHKTIELVPNSSYFAKGGSIIDSEYNPFDQESFVPDMNFGSGRYDNRKNFNKIKSDPELNRMYNMMIASMKHSWELIGFQRGRFNYKLPQIEASYDSILSRIGKYGVSKTVDMAWRKLSNVQQRDENMRTNEQLIKMPDGTEAEDVPKKYIDSLDDPALITSNVIGSVALFRDAAYNYAYKQGVQSAIEILAQNMNTQFRQESTPENPEYVDSKGAELFSTAENSEAAMKYILETQVYGNKTEAGFGEHRDNKLYTAAMHIVGWSQRMETVVMLGLNLISIGVGLGSSTIRLIKEAFMGRYLTPWDFGRGLAKTLYDLPMIVGNFGNSQTNNKTGALMQIFGVSKNQYATYINMANGRISKFLGNILMGGYSMLDWWANAVVLSSYMHNVRFYDGDEIPKGFYSGYQMKAAFKSAGYSKAHANREYMKCTTTLYGVYKYKDGTCIIDPRYKEYVTPKIKKEIYTKTHKRIALYNGVTPDNDEIRVKKSILGRFIFALRGFLLTQAHHLGGGLTANGYDDTTVYDVGIKNDRTIRGGKVKSKQVLYKSKRTAADNEYRMGWDFETGTPQDDIYHNLIRATVTSFRKIAHAASAGKVESRKFSQAERYAAIDALIYLLIMIAMMIAWPTVHDWAQDLVKYPTGPEDAGLKESFGNYGQNYIDNGIYSAQIDAMMMRMNVEQLTNIDITTVGELVTAITSLQSGYKDTFGGPLTLTSDALGLSGHNPTEMCRKGTAYTYETRLTRGLYKAFGAPDNLHASFTSRHLAANQKWYFNQYGKLYEWFGYKPEWKWSTQSGNKTSGGKKNKSKKKKKSSSMHQSLRSSGSQHKSLRD